MSKTHMILGGGGSFGIHTGLYLLRHADPKRVIGDHIPRRGWYLACAEAV